MNKILLGVLLGAVLGALDGATSWFTPEVRAGIIGIIAGSTVKGIIAGVAAGWFAKKVQNLWAGILFGLAIGAILAYGIVLLNQGKYFFAIMLPGSCVGAICGFATQRYGTSKGSRTAAATVAALFLLTGLQLHADTPKGATSADAFARLKALGGTWKNTPYMHDAEFTLTGADALETTWNGVQADGKEGAHHHFILTRAK